MVLSGKRSISLPTTSWASDASEKITNSMAASSAGSCTTPFTRSRSSSPLPLVVKLKMMLPLTALKVMMANTRAIKPGGRSFILGLRLAGASSSRGTSDHEGDRADQADDAGQDEGHLPAEALGDVDRDAGGDGDAHVAGQPVQRRW